MYNTLYMIIMYTRLWLTCKQYSNTSVILQQTQPPRPGMALRSLQLCHAKLNTLSWNMSCTFALFRRGMRYHSCMPCTWGEDSSGVKDIKHNDKRVVNRLYKTLEQSHPLPLPASAASGFRQECQTRRFSLRGCGWLSRRSGLSCGKHGLCDSYPLCLSPPFLMSWPWCPLWQIRGIK